MSDSTTTRVPLDPKENLARMESILKRYKGQLAHKEALRDRLTRSRDSVQNLANQDVDKTTPEARTRQSILRKYEFDLGELNSEIRQLKGRIQWAENRQIPFLKSEIEAEENAALDEELHIEVEGA